MAPVPVVVVGVGARTAVGMTAPATAAAVRAGIAGFTHHPFMMDTDGNPMVVAFAPYLDIGLTGVARMAELAGPAAVEAVAGIVSVPCGGQPIPVFVGLPPDRPGRAKDLGA